jgi:hypothetical protein
LYPFSIAGDHPPPSVATREDASSIDELRAALADAIRDRAWRCVEIIQRQLDERERERLGNVVNIRSASGKT